MSFRRPRIRSRLVKSAFISSAVSRNVAPPAPHVHFSLQGVCCGAVTSRERLSMRRCGVSFKAVGFITQLPASLRVKRWISIRRRREHSAAGRRKLYAGERGGRMNIFRTRHQPPDDAFVHLNESDWKLELGAAFQRGNRRVCIKGGERQKDGNVGRAQQKSELAAAESQRKCTFGARLSCTRSKIILLPGEFWHLFYSVSSTSWTGLSRKGEINFVCDDRILSPNKRKFYITSCLNLYNHWVTNDVMRKSFPNLVTKTVRGRAGKNLIFFAKSWQAGYKQVFPGFHQ